MTMSSLKDQDWFSLGEIKNQGATWRLSTQLREPLRGKNEDI